VAERSKSGVAARMRAKRRQASEHARKVPSHAETLAREKQILRRHRDAVQRIDRFAVQQRQVGDELDRELATLLEQSATLDALEERQRETGFLAALTRRFTARADLLARRSVAERLLRHFEVVNGKLAQAAHVVDELRLTSLELQQDVDGLHAELAEATDEEVRLAARIAEIEDELDVITEDPTAARRIDQLMFEERTAATDVALWHARARIAREGLEPARTLRDDVLDLHGEMARFVTAARGAVGEAGRRIAAMGAAADAAVVVDELRASLDELQSAIGATEQYVASTRHLQEQVLPEITAQLEAHYATQGQALPRAGAADRAEARRRADQALLDAAEAELAALLGEEA